MSRRTALVYTSIVVSVLGVVPAAAETQEFADPVLHGLRLDWCAHFGADCGKPAADLFCREVGFAEASRFVIDENIGARGVQTLVFGDGRTCDGPACSGFRIIACTRPDQVVEPPPQRVLNAPPLEPPPLIQLAPPPPPPAATLAPTQRQPVEPGTIVAEPPPPRLRPLGGGGLPGAATGTQIQNQTVKQADPTFVTAAVCAQSPALCCPTGHSATDGCKIVTAALLDIRIRSYVPPRFTAMGKHYPHGPDYGMANIVSDVSVSGPYKVWPGCRFYVTAAKNTIDNSKSILQQAGELAEAWLKQWSSGVETAKSFVSLGVANQICKVVSDTQSCRNKVGAAIKTGINIGLTSLGIPPEIPDIQELRQHGIEYIAAEAASYAIADPAILNALPVDEAARALIYQQAYDKAVDVVSKELNKAIPPANFSSSNPATWGHMEPAYAPHLGHLYVEVRIKPGMYPNYLKLVTAKPTHKWRPLYLHDLNGIWASIGPIEVPTFLPPDGLVLPIALQPSEVAYATADTAPAQIPGVKIDATWLAERFGVTAAGLVKAQWNYLPYVSTNYFFSEWDLFYNTSKTSKFRLLTAFGGAQGVLDWENGATGKVIAVGTVWDAETGFGVRTGKKNSELKNYYGRIDPAPRCDGQPTLVSFE